MPAAAAATARTLARPAFPPRSIFSRVLALGDAWKPVCRPGGEVGAKSNPGTGLRLMKKKQSHQVFTERHFYFDKENFKIIGLECRRLDGVSRIPRASRRSPDHRAAWNAMSNTVTQD